MSDNNGYKKWSSVGSITQIDADATNSESIKCFPYDNVVFQVTLAAGTGNATYKFQKAIEMGGTFVDVPEAGTTTTTITQTAVGTFQHVIEIQGSEEVRLVTIDVETGSYTLDAKYRTYNFGS